MIVGADISTVRIAAVGISDGRHGLRIEFVACEPLRKIDLETECESVRLRDPAMRNVASAIYTAGCVAVYTEQAMGRHVRSVAKVERQIGAFIACLHPDISTSLIGPPAWKAAAGMPGNAGKHVIAAYVERLFPALAEWPQDVKDAAGIALAGINETRKALA